MCACFYLMTTEACRCVCSKRLVHNNLNARQNKPYQVIPMDQSNFLNLKTMSDASVLNPRTNMKGERVNWLKICMLRYTKGSETVLYKNFYTDDFKQIPLQKAKTRLTVASVLQEVKLYSSSLSITKEKKKYLQDLCTKGFIPSEYHTMYLLIRINLMMIRGLL